MYRVSLLEPAPYSFAAIFLLEMQRSGFAVCVDPEWSYRFGRGLLCDSALNQHAGKYFRNKRLVSFSRRGKEGTVPTEREFSYRNITMQF